MNIVVSHAGCNQAAADRMPGLGEWLRFFLIHCRRGNCRLPFQDRRPRPVKTPAREGQEVRPFEVPSKGGRRLGNLKNGENSVIRRLENDGSFTPLKVQRLKESGSQGPGVPVRLIAVGSFPVDRVVWEDMTPPIETRLPGGEHVYNRRQVYAMLVESRPRPLPPVEEPAPTMETVENHNRTHS